MGGRDGLFPNLDLLSRPALYAAEDASAIFQQVLSPSEGHFRAFFMEIIAQKNRRRFNYYLVYSLGLMRPLCYGMRSHPFLLGVSSPFLNTVAEWLAAEFLLSLRVIYPNFCLGLYNSGFGFDCPVGIPQCINVHTVRTVG